MVSCSPDSVLASGGFLAQTLLVPGVQLKPLRPGVWLNLDAFSVSAHSDDKRDDRRVRYRPAS